ncbi:unnamed protein product [Clavelina lepadiformis]|uniref:G-protein coupled receptors family 1 profile domain-containing protein n=1 Tax=Clavelina lepadiformis TaxID=159417 RepID=A0ABP0GE46_CLALP
MIRTGFSIFSSDVLCSFYSCNSSFMVESLAILVCFFGTIVASHLFILAATVERFIAIQWSLRYSSLVTTKGTTLTAACIWIISFVIPIISAIGITQLHSPTVYTIATLIISSACLLCAFAVILLNLWIVSTAWKSARTVTNRRRRISLPSRNSTMNELVINQDHLKIAVTLSLFVCSFVLSCAPWSVALIICSESTRCVLKREHDYTLVLVLFHAIVIPILYGFRVEEVKLHVLKFWKNLIRKNR